jgi:hypothetical protein
MVTLNKPSAGDTDWAGEVNSNWSSIESALNGGSSMTLSAYENLDYRAGIANATYLASLTRPLCVPFRVPGHIAFSQLAVEMSRSAAGSNAFTVHAGLYTYVNATQMSLLGSVSNSYSNTATASVNAIRQLLVTGFPSGATSLTPGNYNLMLFFSAAATASMNYHLRGAVTAAMPGLIGPGANNVTTATSQLSSLSDRGLVFLGRYSTTGAPPPNAVTLSHIEQWSSGVVPYFRLQT